MMHRTVKSIERKTPVEDLTAVELIRQYKELFGEAPGGQRTQEMDYLPPAFEFKKASMWETVPHYYSTDSGQGKPHA